MTNFLLIVQTGLCMYAGAYGTQVTRLSDYRSRSRPREPLYTAMDDAIQLEKTVLCKQDVILGARAAHQFVKWATVGTEYAWIKEILGERLSRDY